MNRELKFRAWEHSIKEMRIPFIIGAPCKANGRLFDLMQYTGLKDKHGVEIYEGDLLASLGTDICEVKYIEDIAGFIMEITNLDLHEGDNIIALHKGNLLHREIIGNIYENPQLK